MAKFETYIEKKHFTSLEMEKFLTPISNFFIKYMTKNRDFFSVFYIYMYGNVDGKTFLFMSEIKRKMEDDGRDLVMVHWKEMEGKICTYGDPQMLFFNSLAEARLQMPISAEQFTAHKLISDLPYPYLVVPRRFGTQMSEIYLDAQLLLYLLETYNLIQKNTTKRYADRDMFDSSSFPDRESAEKLALIDAHTYGRYYIFNYDLYQMQRDHHLPLQLRSLFLKYVNWRSFASIVYHSSNRIPFAFALYPCPYLFQYIPRSIFSSRELLKEGVDMLIKIGNGVYTKNILRLMTTYEIRQICEIYVNNMPLLLPRKELVFEMLVEPIVIDLKDWFTIYKLDN